MLFSLYSAFNYFLVGSIQSENCNFSYFFLLHLIFVVLLHWFWVCKFCFKYVLFIEIMWLEGGMKELNEVQRINDLPSCEIRLDTLTKNNSINELFWPVGVPHAISNLVWKLLCIKWNYFCPFVFRFPCYYFFLFGLGCLTVENVPKSFSSLHSYLLLSLIQENSFLY